MRNDHSTFTFPRIILPHTQVSVGMWIASLDLDNLMVNMLVPEWKPSEFESCSRHDVPIYRNTSHDTSIKLLAYQEYLHTHTHTQNTQRKTPAVVVIAIMTAIVLLTMTVHNRCKCGSLLFLIF